MASVIGNIGLLLTKQITIIGFSLKLLTKKSDVGEKVNKSLFYKIERFLNFVQKQKNKG
jgi:hypothetical protein